eukprot:m.356688 g.356688  ORF g.356688 m.356688 type:complete len:162 (+) comp16605_c2_seq1:182-667(+)
MPEGSVRINGSEYHVTVEKWTAIEVYKAAGELCGLAPMKFKLYQGTAVVAANGDLFKQDAEYDLIPNDQTTRAFENRMACKVFVKELQKSLPGNLGGNLDDMPLASNYLIENDFTPSGVVGSVVEHYGDSFRKSETRLRAHLKLSGVSDEDALLVPPAWVL